MKITSAAFENGQRIPSEYTCDGKNIPPPLTIAAVPPEAKSLVLIVDDPDAPMGTWLHFTLWNISPETAEISSGKIPNGAHEGKTSFGNTGYGGPCPPSGTHRYFFRLYALDTMLDLDSGATRAELESAMNGHIIAATELMGKYARNGKH